MSILGVVGLLTVAMTLPAEAVAAANGKGSLRDAQLVADVTTSGGDGGDGAIQAYVAANGSAAPSGQLERTSGYSTATMTQVAGTIGIQNTSSSVFTNNANCPVQWPFAVGVPISYGFGWRPGEFHEGVDFTPGNGAHVQAIADGTVRLATESGGGYGVTVLIDHVIDGQKWSTRYAHMQHGSLQVHTGQQVKVGEYLGRTGDTGHSFGAHTHVEVLMNGVTPIDPLPWLRSHNQC